MFNFRSFMTASLALLANVGFLGKAEAACSIGLLRSTAQSPDVSFVWNGSDLSVTGLDITYQAYVNGGGNCKVLAHTNIPGVGASYSYNGAWVFGDALFISPEPGAAIGYPSSSNLLYTFGLEVTDANIGQIAAVPKTGTLDFYYSPSEFCNPNTFAEFESNSFCDASDTYLTSINVTVNIAPWIESMPVLMGMLN